MSIRLVITGASTAPWSTVTANVPVKVFATFEEARWEAYIWVKTWESLGYRQTDAGIFVNGDHWYRAVVIDDLGVEWFPVGAAEREAAA